MQNVPDAPNCPKCDKPMVKRFSKKYNNHFFGCPAYPACNGTRPLNGNGKNEVSVNRPTSPTKRIAPNKYQISIFQKIQDRKGGNLIVKATAGSGKTTTIEHAAFLLPHNLDIVYLVFNAHVRDEAVNRMPAWVKVQTTHQHGLASITVHLGKRPKIDDKKVYNIVKDLLGYSWEHDRFLASPVCKIVGLLKNLVLESTIENIAEICAHYQIEVNGDFDRIVALSQRALSISNKNLNLVDFDDMLYLPVKFNLPVHRYDVVLLDEVQDFNRAQIDLVLQSIKDSGRVLAVGDHDQAMYGFRGADTEAMERVKDVLNAEELPLSITYRCPKLHVRLVNSIFPDIAFEAAENAKEGELVSVSYDLMLGSVKDGDMVLCRTNAPLVVPCFELIRQGVKAVIRGRDIGEGLINLVEKFKEPKVRELLVKLNNYRTAEVAKLLDTEKTNQAQALDDRIETIFALAEGCMFASEIVNKIREVFKDEKKGVVFSTVHRAKGLEADNVYVLNPSNFPHPMAKQPWEIQQEFNIMFVAFTRATSKLAFIGPIPYGGSDMFDETEEGVEEVTEFGAHLAEKLDRKEGEEAEKAESEIHVIPEVPF